MASSRGKGDESLYRNFERELGELYKDREKLDEENKALAIRSEGVLVISDLLKRSQQEARELKRQLAEQKEQNLKIKQDGSLELLPSPDSIAQKSDADSPVSRPQSVSLLDSLGTSPWNTLDTEKMQDVFAEMQRMQKTNTELACKLEAALKEQSNSNGNDKALMDHLNRLKAELDEYRNSSHGENEWLSRLSDEADRLKTKLTGTAIERGTTLGRLQDEIDDIKDQLKKQLDSADRIVQSLPPMEVNQKQDSSGFDDVAMQTTNIGLSSLELLEKEFPNDNTVQSWSIIEPRAPVDDGRHATYESVEVEKIPSVKPRTECKLKRELREANLELMTTLAERESQIDSLLSEKTELIKINHSWDAQYRKLQEHMRTEMKKKDASYQKLQKQVSQEHKTSSNKDLLDQKDAIIEEQAEKIRSLKEELFKCRADSMQYAQARYETDVEKKYQRAKQLFQEQKKENETILKHERLLKHKAAIFEEQNITLKSKNARLEDEITRLAGLIESANFSPPRSSSSPPSFTSESLREARRQDSSVSSEQIEVLKQQIAVYIEDFNSEKKDKENLALEIRKLKDKLQASEKDAEDAKRQMQIYEHDFRSEREEKLRLKQLLDAELYQDVREPPAQRFPLKSDFSAEQLRQYQEYCQLLYENNKISERIAKLKQLGVDKFAQRRSDYYYDRHFNARGGSPPPVVPSPSPTSQSEDNMFYGGDVVRDETSISRENQTVDPCIVCRHCSTEYKSADAYYRHKNYCNRYFN